MLLWLATACSPAAAVPPVDAAALQSAQITHVELSQEEFARKAVRLLREGEATAQRLNELVSVVRYQLRRARTYFESGHEDAALDAMLGAFWLVRAGEFRSEMVVGEEETLLMAAHAVSRRGDEGGAEALYSLAQPLITKPDAAADVAGHLAALRRWQADTHKSGTMQAAGAARLAAARRALLWRTPENLEDAQQRTVDWVERAFAFDDAEGRPTDHFEFDERAEAHRAVLLGAAEMTGLYLRDGDAAGAVAALEAEPMAAIANSKLVRRLEEAAEGDPEAWADLFGFFDATSETGQGGIDQGLAAGAAWGSAVALHRSSPIELRTSMHLATLLSDHSMGDVATLLCVNALGDAPDPRELSWALRLMLRSMAAAEELSDVHLARRVFEEGTSLVNMARSKSYRGSVTPSAGELLYAMGAMESRAGALSKARPLLQRAVEAKPTAASLRLLAAIDRQQGRLAEALGSLTQMLTLVRQQGDFSREAAAQVMIYDLLRESGKYDQASKTLHAALERALVARQNARTGPALAAVERVLADILERYGDAEGANRAARRAGDAARNDVWQLTATFLDAARRALSMGDLEAGRSALRDALDADLADSDLIYAALWVKLLHERAGKPSDGTVEEALARIDADGTWTAVLRDWGKGQLSAEQLLARASTPVEKVEAEFYIALSAHMVQQSEATTQQLRDVANSEAIELVEVRIARDFVGEGGAPTPAIPQGVSLP